MTSVYRPHVEALCRDEIEIDEFEERCRQTWVEHNGPVPDGRELRVGVMDHGLVVGHVEKPPPLNMIWKFKTLAG